jgi:hypothetical protein
VAVAVAIMVAAIVAEMVAAMVAVLAALVVASLVAVVAHVLTTSSIMSFRGWLVNGALQQHIRRSYINDFVARVTW